MQTIRAQARSYGSEVLSQAEMNITVQVPVSMKLNVKGGQLAIGREVTLFPYGLEVCVKSYCFPLNSSQHLYIKAIMANLCNEGLVFQF